MALMRLLSHRTQMWYAGLPNGTEKENVTQNENELICTKHGNTVMTNKTTGDGLNSISSARMADSWAVHKSYFSSTDCAVSKGKTAEDGKMGRGMNLLWPL